MVIAKDLGKLQLAKDAATAPDPIDLESNACEQAIAEGQLDEFVTIKEKICQM